MRALESIVLAISKIYEDEKKYELNSIQGVLNSLFAKAPTFRANEERVRGFVSQYGLSSEKADPLTALQETFDRFKAKFASDLERFKTSRDKIVAHSESGVMKDTLPSFDTMEQLFFFGADFYAIVSDSFLETGPDKLKDRREKGIW